MKTQEYVIIEKAGKIIMENGLEALTVQNLSIGLKLNEQDLCPEITKDPDILKILLRNLESETRDLIQSFTQNRESPETELTLLFKRLYFLFLQKPYYLPLIFDKRSHKGEGGIYQYKLRIKKMAEDYLSMLINAGKKENTFKTNESTEALVARILSGFQLLMRDEEIADGMIRELKALRIQKD
jgi:hypothetical protein